jgi:hypothetical protein
LPVAREGNKGRSEKGEVIREKIKGEGTSEK